MWWCTPVPPTLVVMLGLGLRAVLGYLKKKMEFRFLSCQHNFTSWPLNTEILTPQLLPFMFLMCCILFCSDREQS